MKASRWIVRAPREPSESFAAEAELRAGGEEREARRPPLRAMPAPLQMPVRAGVRAPALALVDPWRAVDPMRR